MLKRSKSVWTIALTLASVALIASAGAQAQGKSAGKGKGAEKAQTAWTAPGHVESKGNGHANHKGNGYGHGPHEGQDDDDNGIILPEECYAAAAVVEGITEYKTGGIMDVDGNILATFILNAGPETSTWTIETEGDFSIYAYDISAYSTQGAKKSLSTVSGGFEVFPTYIEAELSVGTGNYSVEMVLGLCGDLDTVGLDPA